MSPDGSDLVFVTNSRSYSFFFSCLKMYLTCDRPQGTHLFTYLTSFKSSLDRQRSQDSDSASGGMCHTLLLMVKGYSSRRYAVRVPHLPYGGVRNLCDLDHPYRTPDSTSLRSPTLLTLMTSHRSGDSGFVRSLETFEANWLPTSCAQLSKTAVWLACQSVESNTHCQWCVGLRLMRLEMEHD